MSESQPMDASAEVCQPPLLPAEKEGQPQEIAAAAAKPRGPQRFSLWRVLKAWFLLAVMAGVCLGLWHLWQQARQVAQLRFQVEQLAAAVLRQDGVLVTAEPPEGHVTSVNFQPKDADGDLPRHVDANALRHLAAFYHLGALNLADTDIGDGQLRYLSGLSTLNSLILGGTRVTDAGLVHLKDLKGIESLHLPSTRVSDKGLPDIALIRDVSILDLSGTRVTDQGLEHLLGMKKLRHLLLSDNEKITDEGLKQLEEMKGLGRLTIKNTKVTAEGVKRLQEALPQVSVDR